MRVILEDARERLVCVDGLEAGGPALADAGHVLLERRAPDEDDAAPEGVLRAGGDGAVGREHLARLGVDVEAKGEAPLEARVLGDARGRCRRGACRGSSRSRRRRRRGWGCGGARSADTGV